MLCGFRVSFNEQTLELNKQVLAVGFRSVYFSFRRSDIM